MSVFFYAKLGDKRRRIEVVQGFPTGGNRYIAHVDALEVSVAFGAYRGENLRNKAVDAVRQRIAANPPANYRVRGTGLRGFNALLGGKRRRIDLRLRGRGALGPLWHARCASLNVETEFEFEKRADLQTEAVAALRAVMHREEAR